MGKTKLQVVDLDADDVLYDVAEQIQKLIVKVIKKQDRDNSAEVYAYCLDPNVLDPIVEGMIEATVETIREYSSDNENIKIVKRIMQKLLDKHLPG